ncbi:MAG: fumarate hydratase [Clostridiaceae bacterium]|nr:fumarate hydratase [Clostridiaceae bacterium]HZW98158.1 fumarate hydratase [Bacillota bacterium]
MREFDVQLLTAAVRKMAAHSNQVLPFDVKAGLIEARESEDGLTAQSILDDILENADLAAKKAMPICQDTGMALVFLQVGLDIHFQGDPYEAIQEGIRQAYEENYLRKSIVRDPLRRINTADNTPAMIYTELTAGDQVKVSFAAKGFGSENMSRLAMLKPADGIEGVKQFILKTAREAGPNACPPIVIGVGIGGNFDKSALLAKQALMRPLDVRNGDPFYAKLEEDLLEQVNNSGIGPMGLGGRTSALAVAIEVLPTHIAGLPVAVNISCHATRHAEEVL